MNNLSKVFRSVFLVALGVLLVTCLASAQNTVGKFSLPFAVHWAGAQLPAGDYTFKLDPAGIHWMELRNSEKTYFVRFAYTDEVYGEDAKSHLHIIAPEGGKPAVHSMYLANRQKTFFFNVPPEYNVTHEFIVPVASGD